MKLLLVSGTDRAVGREFVDLLDTEAQVVDFELRDPAEADDGPTAMAAALEAIEAAAGAHGPDAALLDLSGDAALAGALVFTKLQIPVARLAGGSEEPQLADMLCDEVAPGADATLSWLRSLADPRHS